MGVVKGIRLTFENCEISAMFTVAGDNLYNDEAAIDTLVIRDIKRMIKTVGCNKTRNITTCDYVSIVFNLQVDKKTETTFGPDPWWKERDSFFARLKFDDITQIDVFYEDDTMETIFVPWGDDEYTNPWQSWKELEGERLKVIIERQETEENES